MHTLLSYEISVVDTKPQLNQLSCLKIDGERLKIIQKVGTNWKKVAFALKFEPGIVDTIECDAHYKTEDACRKMFDRWLCEEACQPVTWERLKEALKDAERSMLARKLEAFLTQCHS